jgi:hypothetical protein
MDITEPHRDPCQDGLRVVSDYPRRIGHAIKAGQSHQHHDNDDEDLQTEAFMRGSSRHQRLHNINKQIRTAHDFARNLPSAAAKRRHAGIDCDRLTGNTCSIRRQKKSQFAAFIRSGIAF